MTDSITFYFDFSSSYSYIAQSRIEEIEQRTQTTVVYRPIVLGAVFHHIGHTVPAANSDKMDYFTLDLKRCARSLNIDYQTPPTFPFNAIEAMRIFYYLDKGDTITAREFSKRVFNAAYAEHRDMSSSENIALVLSEMGLERDKIVSTELFEQAKVTLKTHTQAAIGANVFGAPTFIYRDELFWGADRIEILIETVLST